MRAIQRRRSRIALVGFLAIAGFFLLTEHRAHLLGWWPFLLLPACLLMHLFGHGGHAGHSGGDLSEDADTSNAADAHAGHSGGTRRAP